MMQRLTKKESGFTLIELMIVIAIIGILAAIAIPNFMNYRERAYDKAAQTDVHNAATALTSYYSNPTWTGAATVGKAGHMGFNQSVDVDVTVDGDSGTWRVFAKHNKGNITYTHEVDGTQTQG